MKISEKIVFVLLVLIVILMFTWPVIIAEMWTVQSGGKPFYVRTIDSIKDSFDKTVNRDKYNKYLNEYIKERFGDAISEKLKIIYNDSYRYTVKFDDIMDKQFTVSVNKETKSCYDNLSKILATDPKFLHLYSEWVKKQVGIEDENVELRFTSKPVIISDLDNAHIDFDKVLKLSDDYKEIFENTKNLYCYKILIKNYADSKNFNINEYVKQLKIKYLDPAMEYTNRKAYSNIGYIYIYTKDSDKALYCFICENNEIRPFGKK